MMTERSTKELTIEFAQQTTCHGLNQIFKPSRNLSVKLIWSIALVVLFGGMCWQLIIRVQEYMRFATDTELHEEFENPISFPAVSICNYNRFFNITDHDELAAVDGLIRISAPDHKAENDVFWEKLIRDYYRDRSHIPLMSNEVDERGWPLNEKTIVSCTFHSKPCSYKNFTSFTTAMGRCFTFTTKELTQSVPGSGHGLLLTLNIMQDYYSEHPDYGRPEAGIKVHVHEHDEAPMVEEFGLGIPAGRAGHLIVKKEQRNLMYPPWGICNPNPKKMKYKKEYTFGECMTECRTEFVMKKCGCKPYWAPPEEKSYAECDVYRILECSGAAEAESLSLSPDYCKCDQACKSIRYDHRLSYSTYPSVEVGEILTHYKLEKEKFKSKLEEIESKILVLGKELNLTETDPYQMKLTNFRDNHVMLDVYFESLSFVKIAQSKKVTEISLASDFGGLLGLWLGISIVTLGEFIQFFLQMCTTYCELEKGKRRVHNEVNDNGSKVSRTNLPSSLVHLATQDKDGVILTIPS